MTFSEQGEEIILQMSLLDYHTLTQMLGYAAGAARASGDSHQFWRFIDFCNEMNRTNPHFQQYEISAEYAKDKP